MIGRSLLGHYRIEERLGSGGFGSVYRATDEWKRASGKDPSIAIKIIDADMIQDHFGAMVLEVIISQQLSHPHIVRIFSIEKDGDLAFITMELLRGVPLNQRIASSSVEKKKDRSHLPLDVVDSIARSISEGLAYCHAQKIVHADVKPANIFLCDDGTVKLLDLGIAQSFGIRGTLSGYSKGYSSPQQIAGEEPDPRDDVYSLGCVLYECLTGNPVVERSSRNPIPPEAEDIDFSKIPWRYRKPLKSALVHSREARLASTQLLWKRIDPSRLRMKMLYTAGSVAIATTFGVLLITRPPDDGVTAANRTKSERLFIEAQEYIASGDISSARGDLFKAIEINHTHERAAKLFIEQIRKTHFTDAINYSEAWTIFGEALNLKYKPKALQRFAEEQIDAVLESDLRNLKPHSRVLSEFRLPLCVLRRVDYHREKMEQLRADLSIKCDMS